MRMNRKNKDFIIDNCLYDVVFHKVFSERNFEEGSNTCYKLNLTIF